MSPLEQLWADQHNDLRLTSDCQFEAYLNEVDPDHVLNDRALRSVVERRHLARHQGAA